MSDIHDLDHKVSFTIDGETFTTTERHQPAADLLRLASLDPARYDLGELCGQHPKTKRFKDDEVVKIHKDARFVSIRHAADVA